MEWDSLMLWIMAATPWMQVTIGMDRQLTEDKTTPELLKLRLGHIMVPWIMLEVLTITTWMAESELIVLMEVTITSTQINQKIQTPGILSSMAQIISTNSMSIVREVLETRDTWSVHLLIKSIWCKVTTHQSEQQSIKITRVQQIKFIKLSLTRK